MFHCSTAVEALGNYLEYEQRTMGTPATSIASPDNLSSSQAEKVYKQGLIQMLTRGLTNCRRSVDALKSRPFFFPEQAVAPMRQREKQIREDWTELKNKYGSLTDESSDAILKAVLRRVKDQVGLLDELEGL